MFLETLQIWCEGKPDSLSLCFESSGEFGGRGVVKVRHCTQKLSAYIDIVEFLAE